MAALRAPGGRMQGAAAQAMSVHIVEPPQRRPRPTYAACGGNGGWARRPPGLAAAAPEARYRGPGSAATRRAHGSCWALPSSVWRRLHALRPVAGEAVRDRGDACASSKISREWRCSISVMRTSPQPSMARFDWNRNCGRRARSPDEGRASAPRRNNRRRSDRPSPELSSKLRNLSELERLVVIDARSGRNDPLAARLRAEIQSLVRST